MSVTASDSRLVAEILEWKARRNALILAHNYQIPAVQDIADVVGDSLALARAAAKTDADVIVFCGVHFMAETAAILNPGKTVLLPDLEAGCSLADSITVEQLRTWKADHPGAAVVAYVNTSAAVKAESDYCCTSSNAVQVVQSIPADREVLFLPDMFLGSYVQRMTGRTNMHVWAGECHVHAGITPENVDTVLHDHPKAELLVHPECGCSTSAMYLLAEGVLPAEKTHIMSTGGMVKYAEKATADEYIVATEVGVLYQMEQQSPGKRFLPANPDAICPFMKKITLPKMLDSLRENKHIITVAPEIAERARVAIGHMIAIG